MPYFAQLDENNIVINVVVADKDFIDLQTGTWLETYTDGSKRSNYAGIGFTYDKSLDAFIPPKLTCHPSEIEFDKKNCYWSCSDVSHKDLQ
jgi:hypothetical protein